MAKIKVVGSQAPLELDDVRDTVILLGGKYYFKHDQKNLIKVRTATGKFRLYRKESPLITETQNGTYVRISDALRTADGLMYDRNHPDTIRLDDGTYTHARWAIKIDEKFYVKSDPRLIRTESGKYELKSNCVTLSPKYYGKDVYVRFDPENYVEVGGEFWKTADVRDVIRWDEVAAGPIVETKTRGDSSSLSLVSNVFKEFKDVSNPQIGRYSTCHAEKRDVIKCPETGLYVLTQMHPEFIAKIHDIAEKTTIKNSNKIREIMNNSFGDADETENIAKTISMDYQIWPGKSVLFSGSGAEVKSASLKATGGLGYAFGIEIETSAGVVPSNLAKAHNYMAVGDRSIGAAEYVTPVLHGDKGIKHLRAMCEDLSAHTFVDDRCSVHVHVGSSLGGGINNWPLTFDRAFAVAAIKLGCNIEEELYKMLPLARSPFNRHCHSIRRYENITLKNWREYLGTFVFGPQENWKSTLDFRTYKYGVGHLSKEHSLPTWCGGRYKWLNLVRAYSACSSPTIELRIWSPSTNFNKVYCYTLLSLAFVHVASSCQREVMGEKMTLERMLMLAFPKRLDLVELLTNFISSRKEKFSRTNVYKGVKIGELIATKNITTESELTKQTLTQPV